MQQLFGNWVKFIFFMFWRTRAGKLHATDWMESNKFQIQFAKKNRILKTKSFLMEIRLNHQRINEA